MEFSEGNIIHSQNMEMNKNDQGQEWSKNDQRMINYYLNNLFMDESLFQKRILK